MGRWGYLIFQGDDDLDAVCSLCDKYTIDLDCRGDYPPHKDESAASIQRHMTRAQALSLIENGLLTRVFADYVTASKRDLYYLFIFSAKAMEIGARFSVEQLSTLKSRMPAVDEKWVFYDETIDQLEKALATYPNDGSAYDFKSPGLIETMHMSMRDNSAGMGVNVPPYPPRRKKGAKKPAQDDEFVIIDPLAAAIHQWLPNMG